MHANAPLTRAVCLLIVRVHVVFTVNNYTRTKFDVKFTLPFTDGFYAELRL